MSFLCSRMMMRTISTCLFRQPPCSFNRVTSLAGEGTPSQIIVRFMNRNARKPKKANHGKRPCSHARRREKKKSYYLKSSRLKPKIFGFF